MRIDIGAAASTAWALFKRDRDVLLVVAGTFIFVPALAMLLFLPPPPPTFAAGASPAEVELWMNGYIAWLTRCLPWLAISGVSAMFGSLTITAMYLDAGRPDVGGAMRVAARLFPRYFFLMLGVSAVTLVATALLVLPGLFVMGRTMLVESALVAQPASRDGPIARSIDLTRGNSLVLAGLAGIGTFGAQLLASPFMSVDEALRAGPAANPIAISLADGGAAAVAATVALAMILIRVAIYREVTAPRSGPKIGM
ncbi:MAG: hypothetical protein WC816_09320 [Sphingomonas sp.]|jgi:hypothetical protein